MSATDSPSPGLCVRNVSAGLNALVSRIPPAVTSSCREPAATTYPCRRRSRAGTGPAVEFRSSPLSQLTASSATPASRATGPRPCCAAVAGVADVHAAGLIRRDVQAHLAVARVAERSPSSTPTSLLVRTRTSRLAGGATTASTRELGSMSDEAARVASWTARSRCRPTRRRLPVRRGEAALWRRRPDAAPAASHEMLSEQTQSSSLAATHQPDCCIRRDPAAIRRSGLQGVTVASAFFCFRHEHLAVRPVLRSSRGRGSRRTAPSAPPAKARM